MTRNTARPGRQSVAMLAIILSSAAAFGQLSRDPEPRIDSAHSSVPSPEDGNAASPVEKSAATAAYSGWQIDTASYLWLQAIEGTIDALGHRLSFNASSSDLLQRARPGIQQVVIAQHGRLSIDGDVLWTPIDVKSSDSLLDTPPKLLSQANYSPLIATLELGYRLVDKPHAQLDGLGGLRFWRLGADFTLSPVAGGSVLSKSIEWVDPLIGVRLKLPASSRLAVVLQGDAGGWGVGSQLDYHLLGALRYQIKPRWALDAGWRYMHTDYRDEQIHSRVTQSGLVIGASYTIKGSPRD